jgi:hypothetical protein
VCSKKKTINSYFGGDEVEISLFFLITLELSDTNVYEHQIRALLGTASRG